MLKKLSIITVTCLIIDYLYLEYQLLLAGNWMLTLNVGVFIIIGVLNTLAVLGAFKKRYMKIIEKARYDVLTGVPGRSIITEKIEHEQYRIGRDEPHYSLIMLDIDFFKKINDRYGHAAGDAALQHITTLFTDSLRKIDTIGRWGGEEFVILLPITELPGAVTVAEKLRKKLERAPLRWKHYNIPMTASFGVVESSLENESSAAVVERADAEMYRAKQEGRNRVCCAELSHSIIAELTANT